MINNLMFDTLSDPVYTTAQWNAGDWIKVLANRIVDIGAGILNAPLTLILSILHQLYVVLLNFLVVLIYLWGIFAAYAAVWGGFGGSILRGWGKAVIVMYSTFFLWNMVAALYIVGARATTEPSIIAFWAVEAIYPLVPAIMSAFIFGGNATGSVISGGQGTLNNASAAVMTALALATGDPALAMGAGESAMGAAKGTGGGGGGGGGGGSGGAPPSPARGSGGGSNNNIRPGGSGAIDVEFTDVSPGSGGGGGAIVLANSGGTAIQTSSGNPSGQTKGGDAPITTTGSGGSGSPGASGGQGTPVQAFEVVKHNLNAAVNRIVYAAMMGTGAAASASGAGQLGRALTSRASATAKLAGNLAGSFETYKPIKAELLPDQGWNTGF